MTRPVQRRLVLALGAWVATGGCSGAEHTADPPTDSVQGAASGAVTPAAGEKAPPPPPSAAHEAHRHSEPPAPPAAAGPQLAEALAEAGFTPPADFRAHVLRLSQHGDARQLDWDNSSHSREGWWPASTVKLFAAVAALERLDSLGFPPSAQVTFHYTAEEGGDVSVRFDHLIRLAIGQSNNVAFDRLVEFAGYDRIHREFLTASNGAPTTVLLRCYGQRQRSSDSGVCSARQAPRMTLSHGRLRHEEPAHTRAGSYSCPNEGNCTTLGELAEVMRRVMQHEHLPESQRFDVSAAGLSLLRDALSHAKNYRIAERFEAACDGAFEVWHKPGFALRWVSDVLFLRHTSGQEWVVALAGRPSRRALDDAADALGRVLCDDPWQEPPSPPTSPPGPAHTSKQSTAPVHNQAPTDHLHDPSGRGLTAFFAALRRTESGQGVTRVSHFGDSSIGRDELPHFMRQRMQDRFGDGGPGFVLLQPHSASYRHQAITFSQPNVWSFCFITFRCKRDGHYGLGGVVAESRGGATSLYRLPAPIPPYKRQLELWYAGTPGGGRLELSLDGQRHARLDTENASLEDRWHRWEAEPEQRLLRIRAMGRGTVRGYGIVVESGAPGLVWDTHSMIGAFTSRLLAQDRLHMRSQLQHRQTDLIVFSYGGNDLRRLVGGIVTPEGLARETDDVLGFLRRARPEASCLVLGTAEHRRSGPVAVSTEHVEAVARAHELASQAHGCAFFDIYEAMGGRGSYTRWQREGLAADDGKHLSRRGREQIADWLFQALMRRFAA